MVVFQIRLLKTTEKETALDQSIIGRKGCQGKRGKG
jgi:hypothetical protein